MAITSAQHSELNRLSDRDGVQVKGTNRLGDVMSEVGSAPTSDVTVNSTAISTGLNWDETASEFSSMIVAGSAVDSAGSAVLSDNSVFGQLWDTIGSAISSASA